jgi:sugar phosphate isomerase/epimerase
VEATLDAAKKHNVEHIVFGYIGKHRRETLDQYKATVERTNKAAELYRAADVRLCYHNHAFEFEKLDGETCGFDILMNELDPKLVEFELDVFWTALGGWDPIETMKKLGNRISQLHLKDIKEGAETMYDEGDIPRAGKWHAQYEADHRTGPRAGRRTVPCRAGPVARSSQEHRHKHRTPPFDLKLSDPPATARLNVQSLPMPCNRWPTFNDSSVSAACYHDFRV